MSRKNIRKSKRILESVENLDYPESKNLTDLMLDNELPAEVEPQEDSWAGGQNIHHQLDHAKAAGAEETTRGIEILKIKENTLRKVIQKFILETIGLTEDILGEPDMSAEEEREKKEDDLDEVNALAAGGVRGAQGPLGFDYDPEHASNRLQKNRK